MTGYLHAVCQQCRTLPHSLAHWRVRGVGSAGHTYSNTAEKNAEGGLVRRAETEHNDEAASKFPFPHGEGGGTAGYEER